MQRTIVVDLCATLGCDVYEVQGLCKDSAAARVCIELYAEAAPQVGSELDVTIRTESDAQAAQEEGKGGGAKTSAQARVHMNGQVALVENGRVVVSHGGLLCSLPQEASASRLSLGENVCTTIVTRAAARSKRLRK